MYYSEELSQKTKRGMNETRLKGNFCGGRINYGYSLRPIYRDDNGKKVLVETKVIINEDEAPIVQQIFTDYANGKSVCKIAKELNEHGIKNRDKPFLTSTLYTMLNREKYTGIYRVNGVAYDKIYPPIVPVDIFEIVTKRLIENGAGKHIPDVTYLLRGKVDCGYCGKRLTSFGGMDRYGTQRRYYHCYQTKSCESKSIKKELLENTVIDALCKIVSPEDNINCLLNAIMNSLRKKNEDNATLRILESELEKTEKAIANIMTAIKMGIITETTKASLEECEAMRTDLVNKIHTEQSNEKPKLTREQIRSYIMAALKKPTKPMIDLLIEKVVVYNDKIEITLKYTKGSPTDERPTKLNKHIVKKMNLDTSRGSLFISYEYPYTEITRHKEFHKILTVEIYI